MKDTDWRPTPCPRCGVMREAKEYPVCNNKQCMCFSLVGDVYQLENKRTMKREEPKYVWTKYQKPPVIINDLAVLFKNPDFDADHDTIFELGQEVKLKMQIVATPAHPVTRSYPEDGK